MVTNGPTDVMFDYFDTNGDGFVTLTELAVAVRSLGHNPTEADVAAVMDEVDADKDGRISRPEFIALMEKQRMKPAGTDPSEILEAFRIFDRRRDGTISVDDFRAMMAQAGEALSQSEIATMLSMCDVVDDRVLYEDFIQDVEAAAAQDSNGSLDDADIVVISGTPTTAKEK